MLAIKWHTNQNQLSNEVTKQLFKSGWLSTVHDPGNGMVTIVVNVHESILKQRWEDMG